MLISFSARPNPNAVAVTIRPTGSEGSGKSIPDLHRTIKDVWVSGDKAFVRVEATGMPVRTFLGAQPAGRSFKTMFLAIFVIRNEKITFFYHRNWIAAPQQIRISDLLEPRRGKK